MSKMKHPFPPVMYIEAHAGSSVVIGCSGSTSIGNGEGLSDEMEQELLSAFRSLPLRDKVEVLRAVYEKQKG